MKAYEHRALGDKATAGAMVDIAGEWSSERFLLPYGDVIALSGDFFLVEPARPAAVLGRLSNAEPLAPSGLFELAAIPGNGGMLPGTRDEIICALQVMSVDEATVDVRFEDGGEFAASRFIPGVARGDVERRVRDRFLGLAAANADHFVTPWGSDRGESAPAEVARFSSAPEAYRHLHRLALDTSYRLGRAGGDLSRAMAIEAAAQHYLTDAFASGHLRTPIAAIRRFWHQRYPRFWESLQRKVAADTATALREVARPLRLLPSRVVFDRTLSAVRVRTADYPPISLGDLLGRVFHDWDNDHGLVLEGGGRLFGDGHLGEGVGEARALAAVRAGNDDVEVAFRLASGRTPLSGQSLYSAVKEATGAPGGAFVAESRIPRPSADNPPLNWRARDVDDLWRSPIAGTSGTTVGAAVAQVLEVGGEVSRRLDCLGQGVVGSFDILALPVVSGWLGRKASQAYRQGFVERLARHPWRSVLEVCESAARQAQRPWERPVSHQLTEQGWRCVDSRSSAPPALSAGRPCPR